MIIRTDLTPVIAEMIANGTALSEKHIVKLQEALDVMVAPEVKQLCKNCKIAVPKIQSMSNLHVAIAQHCATQKVLFGRAESLLLKRAVKMIGRSDICLIVFYLINFVSRCVCIVPSARELFQRIGMPKYLQIATNMFNVFPLCRARILHELHQGGALAEHVADGGHGPGQISAIHNNDCQTPVSDTGWCACEISQSNETLHSDCSAH